MIDRRVGLMFGVFLVLLALGVARAAYLGLFRSGALQAAAATEHIDNVVVPAIRGSITDRNGIPLALSESADNIVGDPLLIQNPPQGTSYVSPQTIADRIAPLLHVSASQLLSDLTKPDSGYVELAQNVPQAAATKIEQMGLNGISEVPVEDRVYPRGTEAAQVLGWVGSSDDGLGGLEYFFNRQLAGRAGLRRIVNDGNGQAISVDTVKPMIPGATIKLTLDARLQTEVEQVLAGVGRQYEPKGATAIVTDPQTDQILALANWPSANANDVTSADLKNIEYDQAVEMSYEPGSTFKAVTVAGALQDGLVTPSTGIYVPSHLEAYGKTVSDAEPHGNETLTVAQILKVSSNIGADEIAARLGANRFAGWVKRFGFGKPTGVDLPGEAPGIVVPESQYNGLSMLNMPFGQGESVTPMQMVQAYDAIADGGILRTPQIIESVGDKRYATPKGKRIISPQVASELRDMLRGVLADGGTASGAAIPGYDLAGKTGTANVAVDGKYSQTDYMASFIGMVPASDPKLVIAVVVNDPKNSIYGGSVAAPAFQKIVGWAVPYLGINPCPKPCPPSALSPAMPSTP